jgi:cytochrome c oxidase subunit 2
MIRKALTLGILTFLVQSQVNAEAPAEYQACAACHGAAAEGNPALGAPALAAQDGDYLLRQLNAFRAGQRGSESSYAQTMAASVSAVDEAAAKKLSDWLSSLPGAAKTATVENVDLRNGENLYNANCGACHGAGGKGNPLMGAPRLAGMDSAYMARQYAAYQQGKRGTHDRYGKQMAMMAKAVGDKGLVDTLAWLQVQGGK